MNRAARVEGRPAAPRDRRFPRSPPLLVGRAREQVFLREELDAAVGGHGRFVLVGGEAGIGKTTLARDLAQEAQASGVRVLAGSCYDLTNTPPYGPWLDLFAGYEASPDLPPPPAAFAGVTLATVTDQAAHFAEVRHFFAALGAVRPVMVILEDLHWTDPASLELLRHVAPHLRHWPMLLLVTYRSDELTQRQPFAQQLPALVREADALRLDLHPLDAAGLRALLAVRYSLEPADEDRLVRYLQRHAEGNPFFTTELLRALEDEALLRPAAPRWSVAELDRVVVPTLLRQVVDGRVARLGAEMGQPLALAAVIGQEVPLSLWAEAAEIDDAALLTIVERAVEAHLLDAERDGTRLRFVHALTREALYEGVLPPRRRLWHQRVADLLVARPDADPDAVAYHLQQAGDPRAWEWLVRAADRAQRAYAWLTASDRLRAAAALLAGVEGQERLRARLLFRLGRLQRMSDPAGALGFLDEAERLAARLGDAVLAAEVIVMRGGLLCYSDRYRSGLAMQATGIEALKALPLDAILTVDVTEPWLADALPETAAGDATGEAEAAALLHAAGLNYRYGPYIMWLAAAGPPVEAIRLGERYAAALAEAPGSPGGIRWTASFSYFGLGIAHAALGQTDEARPAFARARELFGEYDHQALVAYCLLGELWAVALTVDAAEPAARRRLAAEAEVALGRAGGALPLGLSSRLAWLGCFVLDGRWEEALQILGDLPEVGNGFLRRNALRTSGVLARHRGEPELAWVQVHALFPAGTETEPGDRILQDGLALQRLAIDLCLDIGDLARARVWLAAHDAWLTWSGGVLGQADGRLAWARYHRAAGDDDLARAAARDALALAATPDQPLVRLAAHRVLGELDIEAALHAAAETHLMAALDLASDCDAPFERALTLLARAELGLGMDRVEEAVAFLDEVRQICTPLGAAPALARADAVAARLAAPASSETYPAGLTPREAEVLRLLARRYTNAEIAESLYIGARTVQTHVAHILAKLGVDNRREAAAIADRLGLN